VDHGRGMECRMWTMDAGWGAGCGPWTRDGVQDVDHGRGMAQDVDHGRGMECRMWTMDAGWGADTALTSLQHWDTDFIVLILPRIKTIVDGVDNPQDAVWLLAPVHDFLVSVK